MVDWWCVALCAPWRRAGRAYLWGSRGERGQSKSVGGSVCRLQVTVVVVAARSVVTVSIRPIQWILHKSKVAKRARGAWLRARARIASRARAWWKASRKP